MDNYIVSARKYRPTTFDSVVGQGTLTVTLKNAIATGKLAHAYLFCGPRGVGKTTCARIFAKTINCLSPLENGEACNECESCRAFNEQRSYNIHELDAASNNSVDEMRQLVEKVRIPPQVGKYKVYIIDEVHMLTSSAFNAFLKTLEEPPHHAIFILATTEKFKIIPTILSRCQVFDFNRISVKDMVEHLARVASNENVTIEQDALNVIATKADGGMRDALSIFDQIVSFAGNNVTYQDVIKDLNVLDYEYYFKLTDFLFHEKIADALLLFNEVLNKGFDGGHFVSGLSQHFRNLLVGKEPSTLVLLEVGESIRDRYKQQSAQLTVRFLYQAMALANECDLTYKSSNNKRLLIELMLIQIGQIVSSNSEELKKKTELKPIFNTAAPQGAKPAKASAPQNPSATAAKHAPQKAPASNVAETGANYQSNSTIGTAKKVQSRSKLRVGPSVSIKKALHHDSRVESKNEVAEIHTDNHSPFTSEDLSIFWLRYIDELPEEHVALGVQIKNCQPSLLDDNITFEVVVDNKITKNDFEKIIGPGLLPYLRRQLKNDDIKMLVRVREAGENEKAFSRADKFKAMAEKNSALLELKQRFKLELF